MTKRSDFPRAKGAVRCSPFGGVEFGKTSRLGSLTSQAFTEWCKEQDIELRFIQPGKPDQNAYIERFNRTCREEVPSAYLFDSLEEVREITAEWLERYNEITPHHALGSLPPARYRERLLAAENPAWNCLLEGGAYGQFAKKKGNNGAATPDSAVTKEFLSCESGWSKTIRRPL